MTGEEPRKKAQAPAEPDVPNAFDEYRRTHPGTWDRLLGDLAPGTVVSVNPYEQTGTMIHDFLEVEPKKHEGDQQQESADLDEDADRADEDRN